LTKPIFLIGFMASGKTFLGKKLSEALECDFFDLDLLIESQMEMSIPRIFEKLGQEIFRQKESEILKQKFTNNFCIVSTGGGTPCFFDNMEYMNQKGTTIFLDVDIDILIRRLWKEKENRPLLNQIESKLELKKLIQDLMEKRRSYYSKSKYTFKISHENEVKIFETLTNKMKI